MRPGEPGGKSRQILENQGQSLSDKFFSLKSGLDFPNLPAPSFAPHLMNGETKYAWFLGSPGPTGKKTGHICWLRLMVQGCRVYLGLIVLGLGSKVLDQVFGFKV